MRGVFVHFLEEIEDTKKTFTNYLTFSYIFCGKRFCNAKKLQRIAISRCPLKIKRNGGKPFHCTVRGYVAVPTFAQSNSKAAGKHWGQTFFHSYSKSYSSNQFQKVFSSFSFWRKYCVVHQWWRNRRPWRVLSNVFEKKDQMVGISSPMLTLFRLEIQLIWMFDQKS